MHADFIVASSTQSWRYAVCELWVFFKVTSEPSAMA
jgi:hypothetical protein